MHVRWRGLELPYRVVKDDRSATPTFGRFTAEPFERGFGTTVGNSLRRVLLSSLEGASITKVKIAGVSHEFSTMEGVLEDVTDVILNIKGLVVSVSGESDEPKTMRLMAEGPGEVTAELIECDPSITIHNPEKVIATLTAKRDFAIEFTVQRGRGYMPASEQHKNEEDQVLGEIAVDAIFSPVQRVRFRVEDTRVGQRTNYDRLVMDVWTNGTVSPDMAMVEAAKILRKHLNPFVQYDALGNEVVPHDISVENDKDLELFRKLSMSLADLELSVRASNCLEGGKIRFVCDLVTKTENDLMELRAFGRTSFREVKKKLEDMGLSLGMPLPEGFEPPVIA
ncbi:MAG: DNA-directed RNA polymerase subunit alpha [Planctomycetes bacterium]|nr:DNA-directed RNA polymerase subunit alpha [Planctomycetota bacterium]